VFTPSSLDLLILALAGPNGITAYDLKTKADVSVAASLPALKRLGDADLLQVTHGSRRSRRYHLTGNGGKVLRSAARSLGRQIPEDFESVLRTAFVLTIVNPRRIRSFLKRAADQRRGAVTRRLPHISTDLDLSDGTGHRWMKEVAAANRSKSEVATLDYLRKFCQAPLPST
jgi:DNA-binding MarR family transcriptional regulator